MGPSFSLSYCDPTDGHISNPRSVGPLWAARKWSEVSISSSLSLTSRRGLRSIYWSTKYCHKKSCVCVGLWGGSTMVPHAKCLSIAQFKLKWFQYKASQSLLAFYFSALRLAPFVLHSFPTCDVTIVMLQYQHLLCTKFKHSRMFCLLFQNDHILQFHQVTKGSIQSEPCSWE